MRLTRAIDRFLAWRQLERDATPKSQRSYWDTLSALDAWLEQRLGDGVRLTDIEGRRGTELLREFLAARVGHLSATTRGNWISYLHSFFAWAESEDLIEADPSRKIRRPPKRKPDIYRPGETELLLGRRAAGPEELAPWLLMEGVGLRASSVTGCRWEHVDLTRGRIRAFVKGAHWIVLPIEPGILDELRAVYARLQPDPEDYVFAPVVERWVTNEHRVRQVMDPKTRHSEKALWSMTRKVCERAGIRPLGPHALRHGFAMRLTRRGMRDREVQALMGHARLETTEKYRDELSLEDLEVALSEGVPGHPSSASLSDLPLAGSRTRTGATPTEPGVKEPNLAPSESATQGDSRSPAQAFADLKTRAGEAAKRVVEAAGIEPASEVAESSDPDVTGDSGPEGPEGGVT